MVPFAVYSFTPTSALVRIGRRRTFRPFLVSRGRRFRERATTRLINTVVPGGMLGSRRTRPHGRSSGHGCFLDQLTPRRSTDEAAWQERDARMAPPAERRSLGDRPGPLLLTAAPTTPPDPATGVRSGQQSWRQVRGRGTGFDRFWRRF